MPTNDADYPPNHDEIMEATHRALRKHGYADLTMRNIAAESSKSHSLLTYHYDTKQNLIRFYLEYIIEYLEQYAGPDPDVNPLGRIEEYLEYFTVGSDPLPRTLQIAFMELQMVALRNEEFQTRFERHRSDNVRVLAEIIEEGIDQGVFRSDLDADSAAKVILLAVKGASEQETRAGPEGFTDEVRDAVRTTVFPTLLADGHSLDEYTFDDQRSDDDASGSSSSS